MSKLHFNHHGKKKVSPPRDIPIYRKIEDIDMQELLTAFLCKFPYDILVVPIKNDKDLHKKVGYVRPTSKALPKERIVSLYIKEYPVNGELRSFFEGTWMQNHGHIINELNQKDTTEIDSDLDEIIDKYGYYAILSYFFIRHDPEHDEFLKRVVKSVPSQSGNTVFEIKNKEQAMDSINNINNVFAALHEYILNSKEDCSPDEEYVTELKKQVIDKEKEIKKIQKNIGKLENAYAKKEDECVSLKKNTKDLTQQISDKNKALDKTIANNKNLEIENKLLKTELENSRKSVNSLSVRNDGLEKQLKQYSNLEDENKRINEDNVILILKTTTLEEKNRLLEQSNVELLSKINELEKELAEAKKTIREVRSQIQASRDIGGKIEQESRSSAEPVKSLKEIFDFL